MFELSACRFLAACLGILVFGSADAGAQQDPPPLPYIEAVPVSIELEYYDVTGRTRRALSDSLRLNGPIGFDAQTQYEVSSYYELVQTEMRCDVGFIEVPLTVILTYPIWVDADRASRRDRRMWDARLEALEAHENGHALLAWVGATRIYNTLLQADATSDCEATSVLLGSITENGHAQIRADQREYDQITDHGAEQAAFDWSPYFGSQH